VNGGAPIRCFKGRGADYFVQKAVSRGDRPVCASAGNFGQALAWAGRKHGVDVTVFAAHTASPLKLERMRSLGADVRLAGDDFDAAKAAGRVWAAGEGARFVEDGLEPEISEGAGTIALELLERDDVFDVVLIPLGNGALINGMARWIKAAAPMTRVIGVASRGAPAMALSWKQGEVVETDCIDTIADGIGVRVPILEAVADMAGLVDDVLLVEEADILEAMRLVRAHTGLITEPAGVVGVAALLANRAEFQSTRVATVLTGGNAVSE
jgi:threonine dehydratase